MPIHPGIPNSGISYSRVPWFHIAMKTFTTGGTEATEDGTEDFLEKG
jgi:hypothetical protein